MSCIIKNGEYLDRNGNPSILYKDLVEKVGKTSASDLFVLAYSDAFVRENPQTTEEPQADKVIEFARILNENSQPLTTDEKVEVQMMLAEFPQIENTTELLVRLEKAFYKDGLFAPSYDSLTEYLYSKYEAENLLSDLTLLSRAKESIEKLKRTEVLENTTSIEAIKKSDELNTFGKFKVLNPYIVNQDAIENYGGREEVDLSEVDESITEDYLKQFKRIPVIDDSGNAVLDKIVYENASKVVDDITVLQSQTEEELRKRLLDYGIEVGEVDPYILADFLTNPTLENTNALNANSPQREKVLAIENQDRDLVYLETLKTEEDLFNTLNLLQTEVANVYHRIEKVDFEQMKEALFLDDNITELQAYKDYFGYNTSPQREEQEFTNSAIETDVNYLKNDFVADFNAEILKNPNSEFYNKFQVNEKGISLKYADPISINQIETYLKDGVKLGKELADYSVISKNLPNFKEEVEMNSVLWAVNNKEQLKVPGTEVTTIDKTTIIVKNEVEDFLNYNNRVFQLQNKEGNNSVYMELEVLEDLDYFQIEVGLKEYTDQIKLKQQKLENYNTIKKNFKKVDLEDNFDCV